MPRGRPVPRVRAATEGLLTGSHAATGLSRRRRDAVASVVVVLCLAAGVGVAWRVDASQVAAAERTALAGRVQDAATVEAADQAWQQETLANADGAAGVELRTTTLETSADAVAAAQAVLDGSDGKVEDDAVRVALAAAITAAQTAQGGSVLEVRGSLAALAAAQRAVVEAQAAWQEAQDAEAAAAAAAARRPTGGTGSSSCATTYQGPPFVSSIPTETGDGSNGNMPLSQMALVPWATDTVGTPQYLRADATGALTRLNDAFRAEFGDDLDVDLTYRDYATQVAMRKALGSVAAKPGTSSHGTGLAMDLQEWPCEYGFGTPQRDWLVANGPAYGWVSPSWARENGSNPEYWHYEYVG